MWSYVVTLGQILIIAVVVSCNLLEVCKEGCVELLEGQECRSEHPAAEYPATTAETIVNGRQLSCAVCTDCPNPLSISLELNTKLLHYNHEEFGIAVTWKSLQNVTGFTLILTKNVSMKCPNHDQCVSLAQDTQKFNFTYLYKFDNPDDIVSPELHIKLIAVFQNGCSRAEKLVIVPRSCHTLHPGNCQLCGQQDFRDNVPKARNVAVTPLLSVAERTWEAFVSWDTSRPCPRCLFYLIICQQQSGGMEVISRLKVNESRTNVSLHNLEVQQTYSLEVRPYECRCGRKSTMVEFSFVNATSSMEPELTANTVEPTTSGIETATHLPTHPISSSHTVMSTSSNPLDQTATSNPLDQTATSNPLDQTATSNPLDHTVTSNPLDHTVTSIKYSQLYSPTPSQLVPTNTGEFMVLYPAVGVGVALVIATVVLAGVIITVVLVVRRPPNSTDPKPELGVAYPDTDPPPDQPPPPDSDSEVFTIDRIKDFSPLTPPPTPPPTPPLDAPGPIHIPTPRLSHTVLLVYSSATPEKQQHSIRWLMSRLQDPYGITVHCSQMKQDRKRLVEWVPHMARECSSVVCICNEQFYNEWEGAACNGSPVHFLKEVINGIVSAGESEAKLSKFAVVYTQQRYVPQYLLSCEKHYLQSKIEEKIARFIKQVPEYQLQTHRSVQTPDSHS